MNILLFIFGLIMISFGFFEMRRDIAGHRWSTGKQLIYFAKKERVILYSRISAIISICLGLFFVLKGIFL